MTINRDLRTWDNVSIIDYFLMITWDVLSQPRWLENIYNDSQQGQYSMMVIDHVPSSTVINNHHRSSIYVIMIIKISRFV